MVLLGVLFLSVCLFIFRRRIKLFVSVIVSIAYSWRAWNSNGYLAVADMCRISAAGKRLSRDALSLYP